MVSIHDAVWQRSHVVKARAQSVCAFVRPSVRLRLYGLYVCAIGFLIGYVKRTSRDPFSTIIILLIRRNYYCEPLECIPSLLHIRTYLYNILLLFWLLALIVSNRHLYIIIVLPHNFVF